MNTSNIYTPILSCIKCRQEFDTYAILLLPHNCRPKSSYSTNGKLGGEASKLVAIEKNKKVRLIYANNPSYCKECYIIMPYSKRHNKFCGSSC